MSGLVLSVVTFTTDPSILLTNPLYTFYGILAVQLRRSRGFPVGHVTTAKAEPAPPKTSKRGKPQVYREQVCWRQKDNFWY